MKVKLAAGQELEIVTPDELRGILGEKFPARKGPQWERPYQGIKLDGSGNGTVELYKVPNGMRFKLHRLRLHVDGYNPATPYTNANGYAEILVEGRGSDFVNFSAAAGGIPASWSDSVGLLYHSLEVVEVQIVAGPASGTIICRAQGVLEPYTTE